MLDENENMKESRYKKEDAEVLEMHSFAKRIEHDSPSMAKDLRAIAVFIDIIHRQERKGYPILAP